jgi:pyridinium-3,5-biscarboxylic acid mononucleotide synthase
MEQLSMEKLLESVYSQTCSPAQALQQLQGLSFDNLGFARVDHHRAVRKGFPEVIFCQNKSAPHIIDIVKNHILHKETAFGTRATPEHFKELCAAIPDIQINEAGRCFWKKSESWKLSDKAKGTIVIASAGTSDLPVAEEARCTVEIMGHPCVVLHDVGVAGIHRLFAYKEELNSAGVVIAIAGMEGALPSVIAGLVRCPVIGVPTSVGYGSHLKGMVPLFAMLNSCASGLTVVNIDNGFGAAYAAVLMNTTK